MWVIDQMVRHLTGDGYEQWVHEFEMCIGCEGDDCKECEGSGQVYEWSVGIPP
jgi:hypothetical protein